MVRVPRKRRRLCLVGGRRRERRRVCARRATLWSSRTRVLQSVRTRWTGRSRPCSLPCVVVAVHPTPVIASPPINNVRTSPPRVRWYPAREPFRRHRRPGARHDGRRSSAGHHRQYNSRPERDHQSRHRALAGTPRPCAFQPLSIIYPCPYTAAVIPPCRSCPRVPRLARNRPVTHTRATRGCWRFRQKTRRGDTYFENTNKNRPTVWYRWRRIILGRVYPNVFNNPSSLPIRLRVTTRRITSIYSVTNFRTLVLMYRPFLTLTRQFEKFA